MQVHKVLFLVVALSLACSAAAQPVIIGANDSVQSLLAAKKNHRVIVRTRSGGELTGEVRDINAKVVVLSAVQGREFFDAVISLDAIEAVLVRNKQ